MSGPKPWQPGQEQWFPRSPIRRRFTPNSSTGLPRREDTFHGAGGTPRGRRISSMATKVKVACVTLMLSSASRLRRHASI
jgi:hypothetical protein